MTELELIKRLERRIEELEEKLEAKNNDLDVEVYTVKQVAEKLQTNKPTVYKLIRDGDLMCLKKLKAQKIPHFELRDFLKRNLG